MLILDASWMAGVPDLWPGRSGFRARRNLGFNGQIRICLGWCRGGKNIAWMAWMFNSWVYCSLTDKILAIQLGIKIAIGFLAISPRVPTEMLELANYLAVQTNAIGTWQTHVQHSNGNEDFPSAPGTFIGCVSESCSKSSELSTAVGPLDDI